MGGHELYGPPSMCYLNCLDMGFTLTGSSADSVSAMNPQESTLLSLFAMILPVWRPRQIRLPLIRSRQVRSRKWFGGRYLCPISYVMERVSKHVPRLLHCQVESLGFQHLDLVGMLSCWILRNSQASFLTHFAKCCRRILGGQSIYSDCGGWTLAVGLFASFCTISTLLTVVSNIQGSSCLIFREHLGLYCESNCIVGIFDIHHS